MSKDLEVVDASKTLETRGEQEEMLAGKIVALNAEHKAFEAEANKQAGKIVRTYRHRSNEYKLELGKLGTDLRAFYSGNQEFGEACKRLMPDVVRPTLYQYMNFAALVLPLASTLKVEANAKLLENLTENSTRALSKSEVPLEVAQQAIKEFAEGKIKKTAFAKIRQQYNNEPTGINADAEINHVQDIVYLGDDWFSALEKYLTPNVSTGIGSMVRAEGIAEIKRMISQSHGTGHTSVSKGDCYMVATREHYASRQLREGNDVTAPHLAIPVRMTIKIEVDES
jgi:hypothetical protein